MQYPDAVNLALRALRSHTCRPVYAAVILRTEYPAGIPEELAPVHRACLDARKSWAGVDAAMRALDGRAAA